MTPAPSSSRSPAPPAAGQRGPAALPAEPEQVRLVLYPDPILRRRALPVEQFDASTLPILRRLATRMLDLMREHKGVGLAGPQVGVGLRIFVCNPTGEPHDDRVYINPELSDAEGEEELEEGCLSLPEINSPVWRTLKLRMRARDAEGNEIDETAEGFLARIWQHETDHLNGVLILDKMPPTVRMAERKKIKALEEEWKKAHPDAAKPPPKKRRFGRQR